MTPKVTAAAPPDSQGQLDESDLKAAELITKVYERMTRHLGRVIVGQSEVLKQVMIALFCQGHCILEGVPGLAKTLMISSIAQLLSLKFRRIQFTPDLMPSDITGTEILDEEEGTGRRRMRFVKGPIFGNIILGDEINRTPPKTQAALLQAMQEYKVTIAGARLPAGEAVPGARHAEPDRAGRHLPAARSPARPLHVQDPRRVPQLRGRAGDRGDDHRRATCRSWSRCSTATPIVEMQKVVRKVLVGRSVTAYAVQLARATRPHVGGGAGLRQEIPQLGGRPAGLPGDAAGGEGQRAARRPRPRLDRGYPLRGPARHAAPAGDELPRRK